MRATAKITMAGLFATLIVIASAGDSHSAQPKDVPKGAEEVVFDYHYVGWDTVLSELASRYGLRLAGETPPPGTFKYSDARGYSIGSAVEILNSVLLTKGYVLTHQRDTLILRKYNDDGTLPRLKIEPTPPPVCYRSSVQTSCRLPVLGAVLRLPWRILGR